MKLLLNNTFTMSLRREEFD